MAAGVESSPAEMIERLPLMSPLDGLAADQAVFGRVGESLIQPLRLLAVSRSDPNPNPIARWMLPNAYRAEARSRRVHRKCETCRKILPWPVELLIALRSVRPGVGDGSSENSDQEK